MAQNDCVLIYSGGLDSTVLLYHLLAEGQTPHCLTFNYGQRHRKELVYARANCQELSVPFYFVDLTSITRLIATGSQVGSEAVPEGRYDADSMKATIVPNRNMIMLSIAVGTAAAKHISSVYYAAHAGDHHIYPDCRPEFVQAFQGAVSAAVDDTQIRIATPFIHRTKAGIVNCGLHLGVPFEQTWSCYAGLSRACGRCGTCVERLEAFHICNERDPLDYVDREYWRTVCQ